MGFRMAKKGKAKKALGNGISEIYGENVFNYRSMGEFLPAKVFKSLKATIEDGDSLPKGLAEDVAKGMKAWALSRGATHYTHWFQPLTGLTAEKHDAFVHPGPDGGVQMKFTGKSLVQGEPDASSLPSGGLRATFEARGYTAWDPTSPAFMKYTNTGPTLAIPTAFCSYNGEALDKKTPLLRSMAALSVSVKRFLKLFYGKVKDKKARVMLGPEQEYFLIDRQFYLQRPDLIQTGRTLFGNTPAKHQQLDDHYFGSVKIRVVAFMDEFDKECWKLGIPAKTRHNEVAPAQYEIAPVFEELNLSVDHNMMLMELLKTTAEKHGFVCLLHEKPFAGVNGSGKHNNWSFDAPDGRNLLDPGKNPHETAVFLTVICAIMMAVDKHAKLLRSTVASAGNDHRLGANEAPPAIMSIFLGDQLSQIIDQIDKGQQTSSKKKDYMKLGVTSLPDFPKDVTDRNRTSPFAFTGTKFEFRAVGSSQSCAGANVVLNTIVAEALDDISDQLEAHAGKLTFNDQLQKVLKSIITKHKRILFNGDNYTKQWAQEAKKRGLSNIKETPKALEAIISAQTIEVFEKYSVFNKRELQSRYVIYTEAYETIIDIEGTCTKDMAKTMFLPAAIEHQKMVAESLESVMRCGINGKVVKALKADLNVVGNLIAQLIVSIAKLEVCLDKSKAGPTLKAMQNVRHQVDSLESIVDDSLWPVPKYRDMLHIF